MSIASKVTLATSVVFTTGIVYFVHNQQVEDRKGLRQGVIKDLERQALKKKNLKELEDQIALTQILEAERDKQNANSSNKLETGVR